MKTLYTNPIEQSTAEPPKEMWITESDCPIIVEDKTVILRSNLMISHYAYQFVYGGEQMIAVKAEYGIDIYEVHDRHWHHLIFYKIKSVAESFKGCLIKLFPELKRLTKKDFENAKN